MKKQFNIKRFSLHFGKAILLVSALLCHHLLIAQNVQFNAAVSSNSLTVGERFQLQFSLNASGSEFRAPNLGDFRILSGPNQSSSMQFVNGRMSSSISYSYVLQAVNEGEFEIGEASIKAEGKVIQSSPIKISVSKDGNSSPPKNQANNKGQNSGSSSKGGDKESIFLDVSVSNTNPYIGEAVNVVLRLYSREQIVNINTNKFPDLNGFWSEDLETEQRQRSEYINGIRYEVADLKQFLLYPQRSGELSIDPFILEMIVRKQSRGRSQSIFDQFFGSYQDVKTEVRSNSVKIKAKALPENKPESFKGAVGNFDLAVTANKTDVFTNEGIDLKVVISGKGNLKLIDQPKIKLPTDFESYDPDIDDKTSVSSSGMSGSRTYKYLIIPRIKGEYTIDPVQFSYFNPKSGKYVTLESESVEISVKKGENDAESSNISYSNLNKEDVELIGNDIRFIKTESNLEPSNQRFYASALFYVLLSLPFILLLLVLILRNYFRNLYGDAVRLKRVKATALAKKRLSKAKEYLDKEDLKGFYEEMSRALYGYVSDRLNINFSDLNKEKIRFELEKRGVLSPTTKEFIGQLETCEMARFAPVSQGVSAEFYAQAGEVIKQIENQLKS